MEHNSILTPGSMDDRVSIFQIILTGMFFILTVGCGSPTADRDTEDITSRLKRLETRMAALELNGDACIKRNKKAERLMEDIERRQAELTLSISKLQEQLKAVSPAGETTTATEDVEAVEPQKEKQTAVADEDTVAGQPRYHHVQKGETVYSISRLYALEPAILKQLNNLESDVIMPGQKLRVR